MDEDLGIAFKKKFLKSKVHLSFTIEIQHYLHYHNGEFGRQNVKIRIIAIYLNFL